MIGIVSSKLASKLHLKYRCAACWSPLISYWHIDGEFKGKFTVECIYCGSDVPGYVTSRYVERRLEQNKIEFEEAQEALQTTFPLLFPSKPVPVIETREPRTREQTLKDLGF